MNLDAERSTRFGQRLADGPPVILPGVANALAARVVEDLGFEAAYVTGAGIANTYFGAPDVGLTSLPDVAGHVAAIRDAVDLPLVVDADTGFGNPIGTAHAVRTLERAGANAIQIEDQVAPKRCGHFDGTAVVPVEDMVAKVRAAVDARRDDGTLIVARTDARATVGLDGAIERAVRYAEAGADITFVEGPRTREEVLRVPDLVPCPQLINIVVGGKTPSVPVDELGAYALVLFANIALQAAVKGMLTAMPKLLRGGSIDAVAEDIVGWAERQRLVRKPAHDELERRYSTTSSPTLATERN